MPKRNRLVVNRYADLQRRRKHWRNTQTELESRAPSTSTMPVHERLALARVELINRLLNRALAAPRDIDCDKASAALASRVDNTGQLRDHIDNAARRKVQSPKRKNLYRYAPYMDNPERARALQRAHVGSLQNNTRPSEALRRLQDMQVRAIRNHLDDYYNGQELDLDDINFKHIGSQDDGDNRDLDPAADFLDATDFCPELGEGPGDPRTGFDFSPATSVYVPVSDKPEGCEALNLFAGTLEDYEGTDPDFLLFLYVAPAAFSSNKPDRSDNQGVNMDQDDEV